ncbi:MAG TPA: prepilin-type N-terminal cleavage/methylation domain-containing protein [Candidatus Omnitrophota bacterium]|nr:prepilin-type N-terminal cleavage/methylation domain-containing protein [Candidatus Omnitrophota bacterium]HPS37140.1 prepilin-type N-terminal cleavage/methylation domain-containing protein [Candidatus Omnitrophota bacterium]
MKKTSGFTLIEVLIVVVIIAVLASLILPRMTTSTKKAEMAEALQMMGTIKRAAQQYLSLSGIPSAEIWTPYFVASCSTWQPADPGQGLSWSTVGLRDPNANNPKWQYWLYISSGGSVAVESVLKSDCNVDFIVNVDPSGIETWNCGTVLQTLKDPKDANKVIGCTF